MVELGFNFVGKLRHDAHLQFFYTGKQKSRGRKKRFDSKVSSTDLRRFRKVELKHEAFDLFEQVVHSKSMKRTIKVVILRKRDTSKKVLALLYTTQLDASAETVLRKYRARFQIEFIIRDAKQHTGLAHSQARRSISIENHLNQSIWALNLLKAEDQLQGSERSPKVISIASWKRRKYNQHLAQKIFSMFEFSLDHKKKNSSNLRTYRELRGYSRVKCA